jgi:hypothetical protein
MRIRLRAYRHLHRNLSIKLTASVEQLCLPRRSHAVMLACVLCCGAVNRTRPVDRAG